MNDWRYDILKEDVKRLRGPAGILENGDCWASALRSGVERCAYLCHALWTEVAYPFGQLAQRHHQEVVEVDYAGNRHPIALVDLDLRGYRPDRPGHCGDENLIQGADRAVASEYE